MSEKPPVYTDLGPVASAHAKKRYAELGSKFESCYGNKPDFFCRAPGRVNIIGEHVDYCGYPVLPMAIDRDVIFAVRLTPESSDISVSNYNPKFDAMSFTKKLADLVIDPSVHGWSNYVKAGYKGVLEKASIASGEEVSFQALVWGSVPMGSGLSSSSALVCAAALATTHANKLPFTKLELADLCAKCENYIGLQSGGMDQAISYLGLKGQASRIFFNPVRAEKIQLPEGAVFFVANSLVDSYKYLSADTCYNMRVVECRLGAILLAKKLGLEWKNVKILKDVQNLGEYTLDQLVDFVKKHLHKEAYTRDEIAKEMGLEVEELTKSYIGDKIEAKEFNCHLRALHVYMESKLVRDFANLCNGSKSGDTLKKLGDLMNQSHFSCKDNYDCSCPELDTLTQICREAGAYGSRLTGAGWGGCTVSLIPQGIEEKFFKHVRDAYYAKSKPDALKTIEKVLFATPPESGAFIYQV